MKIVYVGNFKHTWCTEVHVARDAERIPGVEVVRVQEPRDATKHFLNVINAAAVDADLLIYQRTWGLPAEAIKLWRHIEANGTQTISYHLDLYRGLQREAGVLDNDPFWRTGVVFTADGDPETTAWLAQHDIDHRWMPAAIVSDEVGMHVAHLGEAPELPVHTADVDVVFVGSDPAVYHDEWPWRHKLVMGLRGRYGSRFRQLPTNNVRIHGAVLSELYATIPVVVGDSLALPGHRNYWSDRFYETVGRAGYLVGPNVPGIEQHFTEGEHLSLYDVGALDQVVGLVDAGLDDPEGSRRIAMRGMEHVRAHHTYTHRVRAILDSLGLEP